MTEVARKAEWIYKWDICPDFHGMNDFGYASEEERAKTGSIYGKTRTYGGECYAEQRGEKCKRRRICVRRIRVG